MNHESPELLSVRGLEERAFNAWPALQTVVMDGWVLRFAGGYTKRANSVNAWQPSADAGHAAVTAAPLYAAQSLPLVFRLSPLAGTGADADLASCGFAHADDTVVMTAAAAGQAPRATHVHDGDVIITSCPTSAWLAGFAEANRVPEEHRATLAAMFASLRFPAAFATLHRNGAPVGYGMAVAERGMVGLFDIVTVDGARRQGVGRRVVDALMGWGRTHGATQAYLQVVAANAPALNLYRAMGFAEAYRYHYRIAPVTKAPVA
jgi:N-acetylglutamate synthase